MSDTIPVYTTKFWNCAYRPDHYVHVEQFLEEPCISVLEHGKARSRREPPLRPGDIYVAMYPKVKWSFCWYAPFFFELKRVLTYDAFEWTERLDEPGSEVAHLKLRHLGWSRLHISNIPPRLWGHIQEKVKDYD